MNRQGPTQEGGEENVSGVVRHQKRQKNPSSEKDKGRKFKQRWGKRKKTKKTSKKPKALSKEPEGAEPKKNKKNV